MDDATPRARSEEEGKLYEERFLLMVQTQIQRLLNEKHVRYRDMSKRLGVSEARVSQMFGDEASNLTLRTVARIFWHLGEVPLIMCERDLTPVAAGRRECTAVDASWTMLATDVREFEVARVQIVHAGDDLSRHKSFRSSDWKTAEPLLVSHDG